MNAFFTALILSSISSNNRIKTDTFNYQHYDLNNWALSTKIPFQSSNSIEVEKAWSKGKGIPEIIVAVIDSGIDSTHPDLTDSLWQDPHRLYPAFGWDFINDSPNNMDSLGHGTHIAGIIAGKYNSKNKTSGIAPNVKIMSLKFYNPTETGDGNLARMLKALRFAIDHHANIINISACGPNFNSNERDLIQEAGQKGILVVAASCNNGLNVDSYSNKRYPAAYNLSNIISVGADDENGKKLEYSNFGESVDISAPGINILSSIPGGGFETMSGTSQATAFVSGVAALLLSKNLNLSPFEVKSIIMFSANKIDSLKNQNKVSGTLNAYSALSVLEEYLVLSKKPSRDIASLTN
jgi:thermitase